MVHVCVFYCPTKKQFDVIVMNDVSYVCQSEYVRMSIKPKDFCGVVNTVAEA